jgi:branched-chain amino acid transport system substrate-binding protein
MGKMRIRWFTLTVSAAMALAVLVPIARAQPEKIKIVSSLPRVGSSKGMSDSVVNAFRQALEEANSAVAGYVIEYEDLDDADPARGAWDPDREAENANRAAADPDVMVYLGPLNSGAAKVSIPILNRVDLAMISPGNTYPGLTKPGKGEPDEPGVYYPTGRRNYARVIPADDLQGAVAANWAKQLGATRVYVLDDGELYGHGIAVVFAESATGLGLTVAGGPEGIDPKAADYRALAGGIRAAGADLVFFGGKTETNAGQLIKDLRAELGREAMIMGPEGIYEQAFLDQAGEAAEGVYITFPGVGPSKLSGKGAEWYDAYRAKYGSEPEPAAPYGYEAARVALDAIRRAGVKDRPAIRDAVFATTDFDGVLGVWSFDPHGDTTLTTMSGRRVLGGRFDEENAVVLSTE